MRPTEEIRKEIEKIRLEWPKGALSGVGLLSLELLLDIRELLEGKK